MPFAFKFTLDSARMKATLSRLDGIKLGRRNTILRTACTKACRIVSKAAAAKIRDTRRERTKAARKIARSAKSSAEEKAAAREDIRQSKMVTGQLKRSMGFVVRVYGHKVVGVVGPRRGFRIQVGTRTRTGKKSKKGDAIFHDPANIAHLIEFGHGGPHPAPAYPFMRPAWQQSEARIEQLFGEEVSIGIRKLIERGKYSVT